MKSSKSTNKSCHMDSLYEGKKVKLWSSRRIVIDDEWRENKQYCPFAQIISSDEQERCTAPDSVPGYRGDKCDGIPKDHPDCPLRTREYIIRYDPKKED